MHLPISMSYQYLLLDFNITLPDLALLDDMGIH